MALAGRAGLIGAVEPPWDVEISSFFLLCYLKQKTKHRQTLQMCFFGKTRTSFWVAYRLWTPFDLKTCFFFFNIMFEDSMLKLPSTMHCYQAATKFNARPK